MLLSRTLAIALLAWSRGPVLSVRVVKERSPSPKDDGYVTSGAPGDAKHAIAEAHEATNADPMLLHVKGNGDNGTYGGVPPDVAAVLQELDAVTSTTSGRPRSSAEVSDATSTMTQAETGANMILASIKAAVSKPKSIANVMSVAESIANLTSAAIMPLMQKSKAWASASELVSVTTSHIRVGESPHQLVLPLLIVLPGIATLMCTLWMYLRTLRRQQQHDQRRADLNVIRSLTNSLQVGEGFQGAGTGETSTCDSLVRFGVADWLEWDTGRPTNSARELGHSDFGREESMTGQPTHLRGAVSMGSSEQPQQGTMAAGTVPFDWPSWLTPRASYGEAMGPCESSPPQEMGQANSISSQVSHVMTVGGSSRDPQVLVKGSTKELRDQLMKRHT